jgi:hypothetical protein
MVVLDFHDIQFGTTPAKRSAMATAAAAPHAS